MRTLLILVAATMCRAQTGSDILLASVKIQKGRLSVGDPVNITTRAEYDNQPSFPQDGRAVLFTSKRADKQANAYR